MNQKQPALFDIRNITDELTSVERLFGLIGYPLSHSFSKKYFSEKFLKQGITDCHYELFPLERIEEFEILTSSFPNLCGLNVTIPYKQQVLSFLNELDPGAAAVGAVNTIKITEGHLKGYNTDVYGFAGSLKAFLHEHQAEPTKALVLGTGGAAKAVLYALDQMEIESKVVSREPGDGQLSYLELNKQTLEEYHLIINTTPLGMTPKEETAPAIPYQSLTNQHFLYDLVYNPATTMFMQLGSAHGAKVKNGLDMLYLQAEKAWAIWNDVIIS
jgi:shikimate dehydrogenase